MVILYITFILELCSLGLVIAAAGLWASAGVDTRPKYRDEQTLVGGTIWSQVIIPIGLMISKIVEENLDSFVHGYFLMVGVVLLSTTGVVLIIGECKAMNRIRRRAVVSLGEIEVTLPTAVLNTYNRTYFGIGLLTLAAALFTFANFLIVIFVKNQQSDESLFAIM